jgi:DNA polymerase-1
LVSAIESDGRVHTTFKQTGTATGRLSSVAPNLQNIPVRDSRGKEIRKAFVPESGNLFVSLDYSQIELRILAHLSGDEALTQAVISGLDIHTLTAMKIFNIVEDEVTPDIRRLAKAVNFGIIYGLSPFGLSRDVGVSPREAKEFINAYFRLYGEVNNYIVDIIKFAEQNGYCSTILGRKRFFPEINSANSVIRERAKRAAINAPIQGSAADIIKLAMLNSVKAIQNNSIPAKLILQIHDELIFETPKDFAKSLTVIIKKEMEEVYKLKVPLLVNVSIGGSWGELK